MLCFLVELNVAHQLHAGAWCSESQIGMHTLPVRVEEVVGHLGLLVEEHEGAEVGLLVRAGTEGELIELV